MQVRTRIGSALVAASLVMALAAPAVQAATPSAFAGEWTSIDSLDGSTQHLYVSDGAFPRIVYIDESATGSCAGQDDLFFKGRLLGWIEGDTLYGSYVVVKCGTKTAWIRPQIRDTVIGWTLLGEGTLRDSWNDIWYRVP